MLENLGNVLKKTRDRILNAIFLDKELVNSIIRDIQRSLIEADVNVLLVKQLTDKIKNAAFDERIKDIDKKEHIIKLLYDELISILGEGKKIEFKKQNRVMLVGLYGSGKTTTIAKLGNYYSKRGKKVALVGLDVHRFGASEQIEQLAIKHNLTYFIDKEEKKAEKIWEKFDKKLKEFELVLIDTAGRHTLDQELVKEIKLLESKIKPTEIILVMPADIGQAAKNQASQFKNLLNISGVIVTRMDSTAKGGGVLTACSEVKAPIYFITSGEKINDIDEFDAESFLSRLLGMGDLKSLIERVRSASDLKKQEKIQERINKGKLTLEDVVEQTKAMNSIGGFDKLKSFMPGFGKLKIPDENLEKQQLKIKKWEHIIKSMTPAEIENPELFEKETSRISRVAKGSGVSTSDVRSLIKQWKVLNDVIKEGFSERDLSEGISQKQIQKMLKKFGKKKYFRF